MATKSAPRKSAEGVQGLIAGVQDSEKHALEIAKRFVDTVNDAVPDLGEDGPRRRIIDAAFTMTEQIVEASNRLAIEVVDATESALRGLARADDTATAA